jgi:glycosyltransferase involved in cell wall biosynthesis
MNIMHLTRATIMVRRFLLPVIREQQQRGHTVCVCSAEDEHVDALRGQGIDVVTHQMQRSLNPIGLIKAVGCIKYHLKAKQIDVLVCHSPLGAGVGRIAGKLAGVKCKLYVAHGLPCAPGQNKLKWWLWFLIEKGLSRLTNGFLVMNDYDQALCAKHLAQNPSQVQRIPGMGIDLTRFKDVRATAAERRQLAEELGFSPDARIVLSLAYMIPAKGIYIYFQAAQMICQHMDDVVFLIAGDGPQRTPLETTTYATGMGERFHVLGWRDDIETLMRVCDMFVLPTFYFEGLPVSILEAMACAKPVIATRHRGCEDVVVNEETGLLVPIRKPLLLAQAMVRLLKDVSLAQRLGQAGRKRVEEHFELQHCTRQLADAIDKACTL